MILSNSTRNLLHVLNDIVRPTVLDLRAFVAGTYGNDGSTASDACLDATRRIFEDDTSFGVEPEALGGEKEWVWSGLAGLQTFVIRGDSDGRRSDSNSFHASIGCKIVWSGRRSEEENIRRRKGKQKEERRGEGVEDKVKGT